LPTSSCVRHCNFWLNLVHIQKGGKKTGFCMSASSL
jgi:hypothetical protein